MKPFILQIFILIVFGNATAQQTAHVDFKKIEGRISIDAESKRVNGNLVYHFEILRAVDSIFVDAIDMQIAKGYLYIGHLDSIKANLNSTKDKIWIKHHFKKGKSYQVSFQYTAFPKKAMYFVRRHDDWQVWTQGQGKYTSNWLPSIDDVNDKIEFDLTYSAPKDYQVVSNGIKTDSLIVQDNQNWTYDMKNPMSSYLVALVVGKYEKKIEISKSGIPLEFYFYPEDSLKVEPTYRYTKHMFDFLEGEIGFPYPWQNYKQVPVKDFLYSGMENTSLTIFSDSFVVDSTAFNDRNYITVNAHELAHQWFGDLVTARSSEHHWLQEGFATYYALLAERHVFGEDHYYWQLFENAQELIAQEEAGQSTSLLDPKSSSTTFYKKGAWALHILREQVGDSAFQTAVKVYLNKHQFSNVETADFMTELEQASGQDLSQFWSDWLVEVKLPEDAIVKSLKQSEFMTEYFMMDCDELTSKCNEYLASNISDKAKVKIISQIQDKIDARAFQNSLEVRQAIARYLDRFPLNLKTEYESLLNDKSYITIEAALYNLWANFPQERIKYLQKTKDIIGFNDYNVKLLWLALHLNTVEYQPEMKQDILNEMISYSLPNHHFELRMNAFNYLKLIGGFEIESVKSLLQATKHHNWRFSKYAKDMLVYLETDDQYKILIEQLKRK